MIEGESFFDKEPTIQQKVIALKTILGPEVTALSLLKGKNESIEDFDINTPTIDHLINGYIEPNMDQTVRTNALFDMTIELLDYELPDTIRVFMLGMNPNLNDRPPYEVLAEDINAVKDAVSVFIHNG